MDSTEDPAYAERLQRLGGVWWKRLLPVQVPYRLNLRRQRLGRTLDVGCGIGRNLEILATGSVGVDHNAASVAEARRRGLPAFTVAEFAASTHAAPGSFDSLLLAHVVEHMDRPAALDLLEQYLGYVRPGGTVLMICPQERGFASDPTHVWFADAADLTALARAGGLTPVGVSSFPFPRRAGRRFTHNETLVCARTPPVTGS